MNPDVRTALADAAKLKAASANAPGHVMTGALATLLVLADEVRRLEALQATTVRNLENLSGIVPGIRAQNMIQTIIDGIRS